MQWDDACYNTICKLFHRPADASTTDPYALGNTITPSSPKNACFDGSTAMRWSSKPAHEICRPCCVHTLQGGPFLHFSITINSLEQQKCVPVLHKFLRGRVALEFLSPRGNASKRDLCVSTKISSPRPASRLGCQDRVVSQHVGHVGIMDISIDEEE